MCTWAGRFPYTLNFKSVRFFFIMNLLTYNPLRAGRLDAELKQKLEQEVISSCEGAGRFSP
jgi:hypothetical protein